MAAADFPEFTGEASGRFRVGGGRFTWDTPLALGTIVVFSLFLLFVTQRGFPIP